MRLDWAQITSDVRHALTLAPDQRAAFLDTLSGKGTETIVARLLERTAPTDGFLATSAVLEGTSDDEALPAGTLLGPWKVEGLIGQGGMGRVYRARRADGLYDQTVAVKVMQGVGPRRSELFEAERRRLALMDHPGIARIIDGGESASGHPYLAMDYVDGISITAFVLEQSVTRRDRLRLFSEICAAVGHAHGKLILHRDIKAENVLVDSSGNPRLIDFGISSDLEDDTRAGGPLTLATAAPEQLKGEPVSVETDLFSLGVLLHELVAGSRPARQPDGGMEADAERVGDKDLVSILSRALDTRPDRRYRSAQAMGEDILAFLENRTVSARNGDWFYAASKFFRRNRIQTLLAGGIFASLIGGVVTSLNFATDARAQAQRAEMALEKANWQFGRIEASLAAQQAYSDVLQRSFGGGEDVDRLSELISARLEEALSNRDADPKTAAALSYAIGRNFYFRGDTARAVDIFDRWMAEKFGPPELVGLGEEVYAMMLADAGRRDEAIELFRSIVKTFGDGSQTSEADASNYANRLARLTRDPEDIAFSASLLEARLASLEDPFERLFSSSQLGSLRLMQGRFDEALSSYEVTHDIFVANPGFAAFGRDISRVNLGNLLLAWSRDYARADALVEAILQEDLPLKGESVQLAKALTIRALVQSEQGQQEDALSTMQRAASLFSDFAGENSALHLESEGVLGLLFMRSGEAEAAREQINRVQAFAASGGVDAETTLRLRLIAANVAMLEDRLDEDERDWVSSEPVLKTVRSSPLMLYIYRPLADAGQAPEFWSEKN